MRKLLTTGALAVAALGLTATTVAAGPPAGRPGPPSAGETIVDIAADNPDFEILAAAVIALELDDALSSNRQLTVFAPTDAAFMEAAGVDSESEVIPALIELVNGDLDALRSIVLFHVTPGLRDANSVEPARQLSTLSGTKLTKAPNELTLNSALGTANIGGTVYASNGIIHVIDKVLLPAA
jgi:uncharacterized surface protein with fasciclin (FAS1) repeats